MRESPNAIYDGLMQLYAHADLAAKAYARLRWLSCPFSAIAKEVPACGKIVDVGCGVGLLCNYLSLGSRQRDVVGYDLSEKRISTALKTVTSRKNILFYRKNAFEMAETQVDCFVMVDFLHHLNYTKQLDILGLCYDRLKKGGRLVIKELDKKPWLKYSLSVIFDRMLYLFTKLYARNSRAWVSLLRDMGFSAQVRYYHKNSIFTPIVIIAEKVI